VTRTSRPLSAVWSGGTETTGTTTVLSIDSNVEQQTPSKETHPCTETVTLTVPAASALEGFFIDRSKPPYEVPCPMCLAYALEACHDRPKEFIRGRGLKYPPEARVIEWPHVERQEHWEKNPWMRVKAIL